MKKFLKQACLIISLLLFLFISSGISIRSQENINLLLNQEWERLGGPWGGLGYDIRMHPQNPDIMFVTEAFSGVYKSTDGGQTWIEKNNGITTRAGPTGESIPVFSLTIDKKNPDIIWIGTQNITGIYKTVDGGETWQLKINGIKEKFASFRGFTVDPNDSNIVYAAGEVPSQEWYGRSINGKFYDLTKGVVYRTADGGENWIELWRGNNLARYVWINPQDTNIIYVSTGIFDREAANSNLSLKKPGGVGILKTTDGGKNWIELNEENGLKGLYIGSLYMHPSNPDFLVVGSGSDVWTAIWDEKAVPSKRISPGGVYITEDGGVNWRLAHASDEVIGSVEICEGDPNVIYAVGKNSFLKSINGGKDFMQIGIGNQWAPPGYRSPYPIDIQCDPRNPDRVFINSYQGANLLSEDGGLTWKYSSKGYTGASVRKILTDPKRPWIVYAATGEGLARSINGGKDWEFLDVSEDFYFAESVTFDINNPERIMTSSINCNPDRDSLMHMSWDGGENWSPAFFYSDISDNLLDHLVLSVSSAIRSSIDPERIYVSSRTGSNAFPGSKESSKYTFGVATSRDNGRTWQIINNGLPRDGNVNLLVTQPQNPGKIFALTMFNGIYTLNGLETKWKKLGIGLNYDVRSIAFDPNDQNVIYAGTQTFGLHKSIDGGETWVRLTKGLNPEASIVSLAIDPTNSNFIWAADYFSGVYYSDNGGKNWYQFNKGLANRTITSLSISEDGKTLYAGTNGAGVYRLTTITQDQFDNFATTDDFIKNIGVENTSRTYQYIDSFENSINKWSLSKYMHLGNYEGDFMLFADAKDRMLANGYIYDLYIINSEIKLKLKIIEGNISFILRKNTTGFYRFSISKIDESQGMLSLDQIEQKGKFETITNISNLSINENLNDWIIVKINLEEDKFSVDLSGKLFSSEMGKDKLFSEGTFEIESAGKFYIDELTIVGK